MARIYGITLPDEKRIVFGLTLIYGISWYRSKKILSELDINSDQLIKSLTDFEIRKIQELIEKKYRVEGDLKEEIANNIKRLKEIGCYRGIRHSHNLPVHGQRTKSNARTKRGKRKTIGAMKKEDAAKLQPTTATTAGKK